MIYAVPKVSPGGDRYLLVEFGNEMNLDLNFKAQGLANALAGQYQITGVIETAPCFATTLVHYEPDSISYSDLKVELLRLIQSLGSSDDIEVDSRLFYFPTLYLDPWTADCINDYRDKINPEKEQDPAFVARINGLSDVRQLVRVHSGTEYWAASLGFWPGLAFMMPLDPRCRLTAPNIILLVLGLRKELCLWGECPLRFILYLAPEATSYLAGLQCLSGILKKNSLSLKETYVSCVRGIELNSFLVQMKNTPRLSGR
jgi:allophanate hydrolase subunit 1